MDKEEKTPHKHEVRKHQKETNSWQIATFALAIILLVSIFTNGFNPNCNASQVPVLSNTAGSNASLAKCLAEKGVIMYGTEWCPHCQNQKKLFGADVQYINFVDCDQESAKCSAAGVTGYPTWVINGQNYPGEKSLDNLASMAGCNV